MTPTALHRLADRVKRNSLDHRNPEAFYEEREEIAEWIERHHDHDADRYGDPDAAYDAWRDDQMDRRDDSGEDWF